MKYVFYVQSHIAFYMALNIQEYLKINQSDVKYITVRNYQNIFHQIETLDFSEYYNKMQTSLSLKDANLAIQDIDKKIELLVEGENFELFTHTINPPFWSFVATNPKCKNVHIIEDGSSSYHLRPDFYQIKLESFQTRFLKILKSIFSPNYRNYLKRVPGFPIFGTEPNFLNTKYYGIYDDVFPFIPQAKKIVFQKIFKDPNFHVDFDINNAKYLIFDATIVEQRRLMSKDQYLEYIKNCFLDSFQSNNKIYFKFHPGQNKEIVNEINDFLINNFNAILFNADIPFEQIIVQAKNIHVYGFFSTLLFYSKRHGHQTTSFLKKSQNPKIREYALNNFNSYFIKEIFELQ